jgi:hypothetical protein
MSTLLKSTTQEILNDANMEVIGMKTGGSTVVEVVIVTRKLWNALINVYVTASKMRTFPVPFEDHWDLIGAVDECRNIEESES